MKNQIDLLKINGGKYGVINFNNMIPIHSNSVRAVILSAADSDSDSELQYKALLSNQLTWCNANRVSIISKAQKLYDIICGNRGWESLVRRCCSFAQDEKLLEQYCADKGWVLPET